eukprot:TRINITY_DN3469_c0_g1_i1.p1 TRINITY_DN3469_c0_g1~~TRINITY_DN3469_c0_g1_i1.p1  ORF type:complete len:558 (-),score=64.36 TRINITY_DN3469_c0_g1_i1:43-1695(-)
MELPHAVLTSVVLAAVAVAVGLRRTTTKSRSIALPRLKEPGITTLSATALAAFIREQKVTSVEVVEAFIQRIEEVNGCLRAVVHPRFAEARREAEQADAQIVATSPTDRHRLPPFLGVPITIKEAFALTGMPQCAGMVNRKHHRSVSDAPTVRRLRAAGFVPLGVTNVSELCMWWESSNQVYGICCNPYDPSRIVGGSSGGEGAIIAACGAPVGLGSDIGGSIRIPACYNGVFGHKPTALLVPNAGQYPMPECKRRALNSPGPMARRAEDLFPLLSILAGPDPEDPLDSCLPLTLVPPSTVDVGRLRVFSVTDPQLRWPAPRVSPVVRAAQRRVATALERSGAAVSHDHQFAGDGRLLSDAFDMWAAAMHEAADKTFRELLEDGTPFNGLAELWRWAIGKSTHTLPAIGLALVEELPSRIAPARNQAMLAKVGVVREELERLLGSDGVLLFPGQPQTALRHHHPLRPRYLFSFAYTALFNVLGLPATLCPCGLSDEDGLPVGVQVVAARGNDHLCLAVAQHLDTLGKGFGWAPLPADHDRNTQQPPAGSE